MRAWLRTLQYKETPHISPGSSAMREYQGHTNVHIRAVRRAGRFLDHADLRLSYCHILVCAHAWRRDGT